MKIFLEGYEYEEYKALRELYQEIVFTNGKSVQCFEELEEYINTGKDICEMENSMRARILEEMKREFAWQNSMGVTAGCQQKLLEAFENSGQE